MSDEKPKTVDELGNLTTGIYITVHVGTGKYLGHELNMATSTRGEPVLSANGQSFRLRWEDIIWIAEQRGMFEKEKE